MNRFLALFAIVILLTSSSAIAANEKRIALVIGNSTYRDSPLKNPVNDAKDMATKLRGQGFEVIERTNLQTRQIGSTLKELRGKLSPGAVALIFYAGHGLQIKGENYLPTVDADISAEEDVQNQSLSVRQLMDVLDDSKTRLNLVFLDACRNNPYARSFRSGDKGLARVTAPSGTLISYATKPGSVAADGSGRNGLYTSKLLTQMDSSQPIELSLKSVVTEVKSASQGKQEPWMEGSIEGEFCFAGCAAAGTQVASLTPTRVKTAAEREEELWDSIKDAGSSEALSEYLKGYPRGKFATQAKVLIAKLKKEAGKPAPATSNAAHEKPPAPAVAASKPADETEITFWNAAEKGNTMDDYEAYLGQYPKGKYSAIATQRKQKLADAVAQQARQREDESWQSSEATATHQAYQIYLTTFPQGRYVALAKARQKKLAEDKSAQEEMELWKQAESRIDSVRVNAYLTKYPAGRFVVAARAKLSVIEEEMAKEPEMVIIPVGSFQMGSNRNREEMPIHTVRIAQPFALGKYEVTQGQWRAVMGSNPSYYKDCGDDCPVEKVSWEDVQKYIKKLNAKTGKQYRLPSEAEWEYACRAGGSHEYCGSNDPAAVAWYDSKCHPVGQKQPNAWGLYDMSGNVYEWMEDCEHYNYQGAPTDGSAWTAGTCKYRTARSYYMIGGQWSVTSRDFRHRPSDQFDYVGFRLARTLP